MAVLHHGAGFSYYWQKGQGSTWFRAGGAPAPPATKDVYFGVNRTSKAGTPKQRGRSNTIKIVTCVYAEFDAKDFGGDKAAALAYIEALAPRPSAIVDSGGGFHVYWLLVRFWLLDDEAERERARGLQARWVAYVGGDPAAKDLARVLRVPGTLNTKYDPPRPVTLLRLDEGTRYTVDELEALVPAPESKPAPTPPPIAPVGPTPATDRANVRAVIAQFNADHPIEQLLSHYGATRTRDGWACSCGIAHTHATQLTVTSQGLAAFYSARCRWAPNRTDCNGRPIADAFDLYTQVEHGGNKTAALKAINPIPARSAQANFPPPPTIEDRRHTDPAAVEARAQDAKRKWENRRAEAAATLQDVRARMAVDPILARRPTERAVLEALLTIAGERDWCRPSKPRLAEMADCSLGAVKRGLINLEARGYFTSTGDGGGPNDTAIRRFVPGGPPAPSRPDVPTRIIPPSECGHFYVDQVIHESVGIEESESTYRAGEGAARLSAISTDEPAPLSDDGWTALLESHPLAETELSDPGAVAAWDVPGGLCSVSAYLCPLSQVATEGQETPYALPSPAPGLASGSSTQSRFSAYKQGDEEETRTARPVGNELITDANSTTLAALSPSDQPIPAEASLNSSTEPTIEAPKPVRRRLRDLAPLEWHLALLDARYQELQANYRVGVSEPAPMPPPEPPLMTPIKGPPRDPSIRQCYYALLGKARKVKNAKQRYALRAKAAMLEEWYTPQELAERQANQHTMSNSAQIPLIL